MDNNTQFSELFRDEYTENIFDTACFGNPVDYESTEDIVNGIKMAVSLEERPIFLEGLAERLTTLGVPCSVSDTDTMLTEIRSRFKTRLGKTCPRTILEWIRGTVPGTVNRLNNYDLCFCLDMDYKETSIFFQKDFLTLPFVLRNRLDAVFFYCLYHKKPYATIVEMLKKSESYPVQETVHTETMQIRVKIREIDDDDEFMKYLAAHCYDSQQQFKKAKSIIMSELELVKEAIISESVNEKVTPERLNRLTISALLGYKYQGKESRISGLPKHFTESLPNDVTLGKIVNDGTVSYELLRKTLMLLKFYNFYREAENTDNDIICANLMDFKDELNMALDSCGFAQIYMCHPFDCLLMYCANSYDPLLTLYSVTEYGRS